MVTRRGGGLKPVSELIQEKNIILRGADRLSAQGFTQVPNHILRNNTLSPGAKLAYAMLLSYAWQNDFCFPGQDRLGQDMGVTRQTANAYIQELSKRDFIRITRRGQGRSNLYELNLAEKRRCK